MAPADPLQLITFGLLDAQHLLEAAGPLGLPFGIGLKLLVQAVLGVAFVL